METKISDIDFIQGKRKESYAIKDIAGNGIGSVFIEIEKDGEKREYSPIDFLNYLLEAHYLQIDKSEDFSERLKIVFNGKKHVIHYIEEFKENLTHTPLKKREYDFSGILKQVDSTIDRLRLDLDLKKFDLEVKKLQTETKHYREWIFIGLFILTGINTCILAFGTFLKNDQPKSTSVYVSPCKSDSTIIKR